MPVGGGVDVDEDGNAVVLQNARGGRRPRIRRDDDFGAGTASSGEQTIRTSAPSDLALNRSAVEPGTRSMSPKEVKITSGVDFDSFAETMFERRDRFPELLFS